MDFIDRHEEMMRLRALVKSPSSALAVIYGRRRIGKTRLLVEWLKRDHGLYLVADQSSAEIQRERFKHGLGAKLPGFADVRYPDWSVFLERLCREAKEHKFRGPVVIDELPYLVDSDPSFPSVLQRIVDHQAKEANLIIAVSGSSQRMMQGLVMDASEPLFGRASEVLKLEPLQVEYIKSAFGLSADTQKIEAYSAWGGVPRYWELAIGQGKATRLCVDELLLNPMGILHQELDRLLVEEHPSAKEVRPVLDAIGMGAHRVSEIAARIGHKATSLSRPLDRIISMGLVKKEIPFAESEKSSKRTNYRIADPFARLWFHTVASHRAMLTVATRRMRLSLLDRIWSHHVAEIWEEMVRQQVSRLERDSVLAQLGTWLPASRWWHGNQPEWDVVSEDMDSHSLLLGEVKWSKKPWTKNMIQKQARLLLGKAPPKLLGKYKKYKKILALFVPIYEDEAPKQVDGVNIFSFGDIFSSRV